MNALTAPEVLTVAYASDIDAQFATACYSNNSHRPEQIANRIREDYANGFNALAERLRALAGETHREYVEEALAGFLPRYKQAYVKWLSATGRTANWFITGPANFPVGRNRKRMEVEHKRCVEIGEMRERFVTRITREMNPTAFGISSSRPDAAELQKAKAVEEKNELERMKEINALYRKLRKSLEKDDAQTELYKSCTPEEIADMSGTFKHQGYCDAPYPTYALSNCRARMKAREGRAKAIENRQAIPTTEFEGSNARLVDNTTDNRVQLFFPGKPDYDTRDKLKKNGFRWSPSNGCWQAYRHRHIWVFAKELAGVTA